MSARRRSVDLVGEQDIGKQRAWHKLKCAFFGFEDTDARDIRRQKVRSTLNALKLGVHAHRQGLCHQRLADTGHILDQGMTAGQKGNDAESGCMLLPYEDSVDIVD